MKKILISVILAIVSLIIGTFSFIINDLPSYHRWMAENVPKIMDNFDHWNKDRKDFKNDPANDRMRDDMKDHHDKNSMMGPDRKDMPDDRQDHMQDMPHDRQMPNDDSSK